MGVASAASSPAIATAKKPRCADESSAGHGDSSSRGSKGAGSWTAPSPSARKALARAKTCCSLHNTALAATSTSPAAAATVRPSPRAATGNTTKGGKATCGEGESFLLKSTAQLTAAIDAVLDEAKQHESDADKALSEASFESRLGVALLRNEKVKKALEFGVTGSKAALASLLRDWDSNGDGELSKVELRQVRLSLCSAVCPTAQWTLCPTQCMRSVARFSFALYVHAVLFSREHTPLGDSSLTRLATRRWYVALSGSRTQPMRR